MGEVKVCRSCGESKTIEAFGWRSRFERRWRNSQCRLCKNVYSRARHRAIHAIKLELRAQLRQPIAASDPWLDLEVVAECWGDCVEAGNDAVERMVKKIVSVCWSIAREASDLYAAAIGYLADLNDLALVEARLRDVLALAVVA